MPSSWSISEAAETYKITSGHTVENHLADLIYSQTAHPQTVGFCEVSLVASCKSVDQVLKIHTFHR